MLNALILGSYDKGTGRLSETARMAFANAWALQSHSGPVAGAWVWQNFHYTPWESPESEYHGAALMAEAVGSAPGGYSRDPAIAPNLLALRSYLHSHYDAQPLLNKIVVLWASAHLPDLLRGEQREQLIGEIGKLQREDGGWSLADLGTWHRVDNTALVTRPDGYATGLIVLTLEESRSRSAAATIERGRAWLIANQDKSTGAWPGWSLNKDRDPEIGRRSLHERRGDCLCRARAGSAAIVAGTSSLSILELETPPKLNSSVCLRFIRELPRMEQGLSDITQDLAEILA